MRNDAESRLTIPVGAKERATVPLEGHSGNGPDNFVEWLCINGTFSLSRGPITPTVLANESFHAPVADVQYCRALFARLREPFATHGVHLPPPGRKAVQERMLQGGTEPGLLHGCTRSLLCPNARILHMPQPIVRRHNPSSTQVCRMRTGISVNGGPDTKPVGPAHLGHGVR